MECEYCKAGRYNVCPGIPFFGAPPTDGCFRDYIAWPARLVIKIPDSLSLDEAAMVEPLAIGIYAVELSELKPNDAVAILGVGAIGLSVLQAAKVAGVKRIIVSEPVEARRNLALKLGACEAIDPLRCKLSEEVNRLTDGRGADVVFECAGEDEAVRESSRIAAVLGKVMIVGIPRGDDYPFDASTSRRKELRAIFVRRSNLTTEKAIEWIAEGKADVACYATHGFPLEQTEQAMKLAVEKRDGVVRAMVAVS
jgi:L-iditol 2-dehydrogenase